MFHPFGALLLVVGRLMAAAPGQLESVAGDLAAGVPPSTKVSRSDDATHGRNRPAQLMQDPSFEAMTPGLLPSTVPNAGWEVQRSGRAAISKRLVVACVEDQASAKSGKQCLSLSIPKDTVGFEFVTVGQRVPLAEGMLYEASLWVRWPDGPDVAPAGASPTSGHPSAIVSFWARHRNGKGTFAGRDHWLFDNHWRRLAFRFYAVDPQPPTFVYVSLLPNQKAAETTVLVDDFELVPVDVAAEADTRQGNLIADASFDAQQTGRIAAPWSFVNLGGTSISAQIAGPEPQRRVSLEMPQETSNFESGQLSQHLNLQRGVRYEISCRLRWENFAADANPPIVNYGIYHEGSGTWYGPIDQVLEKNGNWNTYRFTHIPPLGGPWKLYVQLNGWGNFGHAVSISVDRFTCTIAR